MNMGSLQAASILKKITKKERLDYFVKNRGTIIIYLVAHESLRKMKWNAIANPGQKLRYVGVTQICQVSAD
jgi:hypothetical protein